MLNIIIRIQKNTDPEVEFDFFFAVVAFILKTEQFGVGIPVEALNSANS